jgi:hypothetical protein
MTPILTHLLWQKLHLIKNFRIAAETIWWLIWIFDAFDVLLEGVIISEVPECPQESIQEESEQVLMKG